MTFNEYSNVLSNHGLEGSLESFKDIVYTIHESADDRDSLEAVLIAKLVEIYGYNDIQQLMGTASVLAECFGYELGYVDFPQEQEVSYPMSHNMDDAYWGEILNR